MPLYICGFLVLGASFQKHLSVGALVMGWGIAEVAVMIATVAVYAYCNDCFPTRQVSLASAPPASSVIEFRPVGGDICTD